MQKVNNTKLITESTSTEGIDQENQIKHVYLFCGLHR